MSGLSEIIMDEAYYDACVERAEKLDKLLRARFSEAFGKKKGPKILEGMLAYASAPGRGTPVRVIITSHPTYKSKYLR